MRDPSVAPRALAAIRIYDQCKVYLCDECEGRLLCVAAGGAPTDFRWSDGRMVCGYCWANRLVDRILDWRATPASKMRVVACACGKRADRKGSPRMSV